MQISNIDPTTLRTFSQDMWKRYRNECGSFEEASQRAVEDFYNLFHSGNEPEFALVRIFRTLTPAELLPELQAQTDDTASQYLTLMGTVGLEAAWCDRRQSQNRQLIPVNEQMSPMFRGVFKDLGLSWRETDESDIVHGERVADMPILHYFYVEDVNNSPYITDQEQFVHSYGIQSAFGTGIQFTSGAAFVLLAFSRQHITPEQVKHLTQISPHLSTLLAMFDAKKALWAG